MLEICTSPSGLCWGPRIIVCVVCFHYLFLQYHRSVDSDMIELAVLGDAYQCGHCRCFFLQLWCLWLIPSSPFPFRQRYLNFFVMVRIYVSVTFQYLQTARSEMDSASDVDYVGFALHHLRLTVKWVMCTCPWCSRSSVFPHCNSHVVMFVVMDVVIMAFTSC